MLRSHYPPTDVGEPPLNGGGTSSPKDPMKEYHFKHRILALGMTVEQMAAQSDLPKATLYKWIGQGEKARYARLLDLALRYLESLNKH
jgi:predicted transcriptional regulator